MNFKITKEIKRFFQEVVKRSNSIVIVSEPIVATIYNEFLIDLGYTLYLLPTGEEAKSRKSKNDLEDFLLRNSYGKETELIAFGGGSVSDLTGFVASTYMRGILFSIIPTSLIAYVDASIGGKNGINTYFGKNHLGTFYDPVDVCREKSFLKSLIEIQYFEQYAEVFKITLCFCKEITTFNSDSIEIAIQLKQRVVSLDRFEKRDRKVLNFGHTFAHAFETFTGYSISHGNAVWHGIYFASF